jgi:hypothetical protein
VTATARCLAFAAALLVLNTAAHFLPPERASVGPDDYSYLVRFGSSPVREILHVLSTERQRPLQLLALGLQARLVGGGPLGAFLLPYLSSTFLVLSAFALLRALMQDDAAAFVGAALFNLLPQTVEVYHTAMYFNVNAALSLWLLCAAAFFRFLVGESVRYLFLAVLLYAVALFWYEVGFFLPLAFFAWGWRLGRERRVHALWFAPIAVLYFVYGHTSWLGVAPGAYGHSVGWDPKPILLLLSFAIGPHLARNVLYGAFNFPRIESGWLALLLALDALLIYAFWRWRRTQDLRPAPHAALLGVVLAAAFLLPFTVQAHGGIAGRHLVLPSLGLVLPAVQRVSRTRHARVLMTFVGALALIVAQGNAWAQVVACRINAAVYRALQERATDVRASPHVVIDLESFTRRIPFTWVRADFDQLNSYYGAQAFEDWGLLMMTRLAAGDPGKSVHLAVSSPRRAGESLQFLEGRNTGSRSFEARPISIPAEGVVRIGFDEAFGREFRDGRGRP